MSQYPSQCMTSLCQRVTLCFRLPAVDCFFPKFAKGVRTEADISGFDGLRWDDAQRIKAAISGEGILHFHLRAAFPTTSLKLHAKNRVHCKCSACQQRQGRPQEAECQQRTGQRADCAFGAHCRVREKQPRDVQVHGVRPDHHEGI
jgi:hypothetical protein